MNRDEVERFFDDLESGAFRACGVDRHKIALGIVNRIKGRGITWPEIWDDIG